MPYIKAEQRRSTKHRGPQDAGELNFAITQLLIDYVKLRGLQYQTINDIKGALIGSKDEFERRIVGHYEDQKIYENGDVYQDILPQWTEPPHRSVFNPNHDYAEGSE